MRLWLLLLLAVAAVLSSLSEGRTMSKHELKVTLARTLPLPRWLWKYREQIVNIIVCELARKTQLETDFEHVLGDRKTTTIKPMNKMTSNTITKATTPTTIATNTTTTRATPAADPDEEGSGSGMTMEDRMNEEENKFDEVEMMHDDNSNNGENDGEETDDAHENWSTYWSLGYYGIFSLSDSYFCSSGYRWSRNLCGTSCTNFTDDDITDDLNCFVTTGWWRYILRNPSDECNNYSRG